MYLEVLAIIFMAVPVSSLLGEGSQSEPSFNQTYERDIMLKFRNSFGSSRPIGWEADDHCQWSHLENNVTVRDVFCDDVGRVRGISLISDVASFVLKSTELLKEMPGLSALQELTISRHRIQASIPEEWGNWTSLQSLNLTGMSLQGRVPDSLANLHNLTLLDLSNNQLVGKQPDFYAGLQKLLKLDMSNNAWDASMLPSSLAQATSIQSIAFQGAQLIGGIPAWLRDLTALQNIDLSENGMENVLPAWLTDGTLRNLNRLALNNNAFWGTVPKSFAPHLKTLHLQYNFLTGTPKLPSPPTQLTDFVFSFNCLSTSSLQFPQRPSAECLEHVATHDVGKDKGGLSVAVVAIISSVAAMLLVLAALCAFLFLHHRKAKLRSGMTVGNVKSWKLSSLVNATDNFSDERKIGTGRLGTVYRGDHGGTTVAVKRLAVGTMRSRDAFLKEVEIVRRIHHRNLVSLQGYCIEGVEQLLIYDFIPRGSLEAWLSKGAKEQLPWHEYMDILLGTAEALCYLHHGCNDTILHRNIKPANILIDSDYKPRISDFGFSWRSLAPTTNAVNQTARNSVNFHAPEYAETGQVTDKSEVYSFGMIILAVICNRVLRSENGGGVGDGSTFVGLPEIALAAWQQNRVLDLIAPHFDGIYDRIQARKLVSIALLCLQRPWDARPSMESVLKMMTSRQDVPITNVRL